MSYDLLFRQAIELHQNGHLSKAEQIYRQILETVPQQPDVLNLLGLIAQSRGIHAEAVNLFYRAIQNSPKRAAFHFNLGISLNFWNKPREALEAFKQALQLDPKLKEAELQLGNIYMELKQPEESHQAYQRALVIDAEYAEAKTRLAMVDYNQNPQTAIDQLIKITAAHPDDPLAFYFLSEAYYHQGKFQLAQELIFQAEQISPQDDRILALSGLINMALQQHNIAHCQFSKALQTNPHNIEALVNLANLETTQHNYSQAENLYLKALEFSPQDIDARLNYANLLYLQHRLSEALEAYRQVIILNPKIAEASNNLGIILKDLGEYEEALGLFFNALALKPKLKEISINLSETLTLFHQKEPETASKIAANWLSQTPDNLFARHINAAFNSQNNSQMVEYSQHLFDNFASGYEQTLQKISYQVPQLMKKLLGEISGSILDLGCGSGLLGAELKTVDNLLTGVDISSAMLNIAQSKNIYSHLENRDILRYLTEPHPQFDFIVAADVFCYLGNLEPVISACFPTPLCFSVENGESDFALSPQGRYQHSPQYVKNLLSKIGYNNIQSFPAALRSENAAEVSGTIFIAHP